VRLGLHRDITALAARLPAARLVDSLINDFATAAATTQGYFEAGDRLAGDVRSLTARLDDPATGLGRMRP
jgi:hypothetical protein